MERFVKVDPTYNEVAVSPNASEWENSRSEKYREYRKKWTENPKKQIVGSFPIHLDLECTRVCNLRCPMCPRTLKIERGEKLVEGSMNLSLYKTLVDEGAENGLYSIKLNYLGEPLVCKDIIEMVRYAKERGIVDVMFNTNGVLLTEEMSRKLIEAGIDKIFISFDSPSKERYESIRVGARFDKVFNNVKRLSEIRKEMGLVSPLIRVSMVVMKENRHEVLDYIKLWKGIVDYVGFSDYNNPQGMDKTERYATVLTKRENFVCSQLYQRLFVHWDGSMGLCCADYDACMGLGNANDVAIKEVWLGEKMRKLRELHETGKWETIDLCKNCGLPYA